MSKPSVLRSATIVAVAWILSIPGIGGATHPDPLPDSVASPNVPYTIRFTNNSPYAPPAGGGDDLNFLPTTQAQRMSDALDNGNPSVPGNPNGYHPAYIGLGFLAPNFSSHEVQVYDCNAHDGCDTADSGGTIIRFLAPWFVNKSEACIRLVAGHELFHQVQFNHYGGFNNWPSWGGMPTEGTARMMQDKIYGDLDANAGCITFAGEAGNAQAQPNFTLWTGSGYVSALFWSYLTEQLGATLTEPGRGVDFILRFFQNAAARQDSPDTMATLRTTIGDFDTDETLENLFHDYAITNSTTHLDVTGLPDGLRYRYADESDGNGILFPDVTPAWTGTVPPQKGPQADSVLRWGSKHFIADLRNAVGGETCTGVAGFLSDGDLAGYGLVAVKPANVVNAIYKGVNGHFAKAVLQRRLDPYTQLRAVVVGRQDAANFTYTFACGQAGLNIKQPINGTPAYVGQFNAPERFQVRVVVSGPAALGVPSVEGLSASDFQVFVGPEAPANAAQVLSGARVQGEYWLVVQAPTKPVNGDYDLLVKLSDVASDSELAAVRYQPRILDQVLVIDRSGSMLDPVGSTKIDAAKNAATVYVDTAGSQDRIGSVSFSGDGVEPNDDATLDRLLANVSDAQRAATKSAITALAAGGATSIGDGLDKGRNEFVIRGSPLGEDWIVLLSDGMENEAKSWTTVRPSIQAAGIKINTIALGPITDQAKLQQIATDTGGVYYYVDVGSAGAAALPAIAAAGAPSSGPLPNRLSDAYTIAAEHMNRDERLWEQTGMAGAPQEFDLPIGEGGIENARFSFNWSNSADKLDVTIERPDHSIVTDGVAGARIFSSPTHKVFHVGNLGAGIWSVTLSAAAGAPEYLGILSGRNRQGASLDTYFGEYHPNAAIKAQGGLFLRGLPMPILATLTDRNGPVTGANIEATVEHPDGTLILLPLLDDGNHSDGDANDGIYANQYTRTTVASETNGADVGPGQRGSYPVRIAANGIDSLSQPFVRIRKGAFQIFESPRDNTGPSDVDMDGMPSRYEVLHGCLKFNVADGGLDADEDGIKNREEYDAGTDPCHPDTDRGGESDLSEMLRGANVFDLRDDALPRPEDVEVFDYVPDHAPAPQLLPNSNLIRYPVNTAYVKMRLRRSTSPTGPFSLITTFDAQANKGLYRDSGLINGIPYYYKLVALDLNASESAPSPVFQGTPVADPTPPRGRIDINAGADFIQGLNAVLSLDSDPDTVQMRLGDAPDLSAAPWQPFAPSLPWLLSLQPGTSRAGVFVQFRDAAGNVSQLYNDEIEVVPAGSLGGIQGLAKLADSPLHEGTGVFVQESGDAPPGFTNAVGSFLISPLVPGTYDLRFERTGYIPLTLTGVVVPAGAPVVLPSVMLVPMDSDADGVSDNVDDCTLVQNPSQLDTDSDGYGNACDPDFDQNGVVNAADLARLKSVFFKQDPLADLNGDGVVNAVDLAMLKGSFFRVPGPSGLACAGHPPCGAGGP